MTVSGTGAASTDSASTSSASADSSRRWGSGAGRYEGRGAIITGGARGIGLAVGERLAAEGCRVVLVDRDAEAVARAADRLPVPPGWQGAEQPHLGLVCDVTDAASVESTVERAVETVDGLHVLVNNAGITRDNLLHKMTEDDWDSVVAVHLKGAFLMARAAQRHFVAQRLGRIVNLSSVSASGNRGQANYAAAKMGIQGFTRTLAIELGPFGITVNAVAPGFIATEMTDATAHRLGVSVEEFRAASAAQNPVRRMGLPEDIAAAVAFLASDEASFVTGQTLLVDGGLKLIS